jgi:hypothetical protein
LLALLLFLPPVRAWLSVDSCLICDTRVQDTAIDVSLALVDDPPKPFIPIRLTAMDPTPAPVPAPVIERPNISPGIRSPRPDSGVGRAATPTKGQETSFDALPSGTGKSALHSDGAETPSTSKGGTAEFSSKPAFFQIPAVGKKIVYVIDRSASMGLGGTFKTVRQELISSLEHLPADVSFQVILYNRSAEPLRIAGQVSLVPATAGNKAEALALLQSIQPEGGTEHVGALRRALSLQPDVIFFLTDADDLLEGQVRTMTQLNRGRTVIHTIELSGSDRPAEERPIRWLARANGGVAVVRKPF